MLVSYKEKIIISLLIIILDGILAYFLFSYVNNIKYFYPMLTISLIPFLYKESSKNYLKLLFFLGIIYDLLYSNLFLFHPMIFILLGKVNLRIIQLLKENIFSYMLLIIIDILIYDGIFFLLVLIANYEMVTYMDYFYKIEYSSFNVLLAFIYYPLLKLRS